MKKIFTRNLLLCLFTLFNTGLLSAQSLFNDDFTYSGALTANGWTAVTTGSGTNPVSTTTGLTYSGLTGSGIGNAALVGNAGGEDVNITFAAQNTDGQDIYFSALVNVTDAAATKSGDYFLHIGTGGGAGFNSFAARVAAKITASGVNFGVTNSGTLAYGTTNFAKNTTYLLIVKYTISVAGNDPVSLWVIPSGVPASEALAGTPESTTSATAGQNSINTIALRQGSATTSVQTVVDAIKVGTTWASVTPSGAPIPALTAAPPVSGLVAVSGNVSNVGSYTLSGANLTGFPGNITLTPSANVEISLSSSTGFTDGTLTVPYTSATLAATTIYVRIADVAPLGTFSGTVSNAGGGASTPVSVAVSGNVVVAEPTVQASNILVSGISDNGFTLNWTNGNGESRLVAVRQTTTPQVFPVDGTTYTTTLGGGNTIWYNSTAGGPVNVTGLTAGTNYTIQAYEYNGTAAGTLNYLTSTAANNPVAVSTTGISPNIQQGFFTAEIAPLYGGRATFRTPIVTIATISGLAPNTTYRYYSSAAAATDFNTTVTAGTLIMNDYTVSPASFFTASSGSLTTAAGYGKFTTNASGKFTGTFGFFPTTNGRFDAGAQVYPVVTIGEDITASVAKYRFALNQSITMIEVGAAATANTGSFIKGTSLATPNNVVALWKSVDGNLVATRPLAMTLVENTAATSSFPAPYDETDGAWNTIIPNVNPEGVRLIQQIAPTGAVIGCNSDADGTWPSGAVTVNPTNGFATGIQITVTDAPINGGVCFGVLPVTVTSFTAQKVNRTVSLKWTTSQEVNSRNFVIERSSDNRTWTSIATVAAAGSSATARNYAYTDNNPVKGMNYYRIKQVDIDSRSTTSIVRPVLFTETYAITIGPNPATDFVNVYISKNDLKPTQVIVSDVNGKIVEKFSTADAQLKISTARYAKGVYLVKVISDENTTTQKIIVQ